MSRVQSVLFPKVLFKKSDAERWLRANNFKILKVDETKNFYRYRQFKPLKKYQFRMKVLENGVKLVIAF